MRYTAFALLAALLFTAPVPARAESNDLEPEADGTYLFERSPAHGGWLAKVNTGNQLMQISMTFQNGDLYDVFQAMGKSGFQKVTCQDARGVKIQGYFVVHIFSIGRCQF